MIEARLARRPRVAMVVTSVLAVRWFLAPHLRMLAQYWDVTLLVRNDYPEELRALALPVRIIEIQIARKISPLSDIRALAQLLTIFRRERFDLVHTVTPKAGLLGILAAFLCRVPIRLHTFQGEIWAHRRGVMRWLLRSLDWVVARLATHLTIVSKSERAFLEANGVLPHGKAQVLGEGTICGVDIDRFQMLPGQRGASRSKLNIGADDWVFLFLGRLCADKGLPTLGEAVLQLLPRHPNVKLVVVGPDEEDMVGWLKDLFRSAPASIQIHSFTRVPESFIAASDVLVLPSKREGFGMVVLEAAAMGVPSIGSDIYGLRDAIVDGETGLLCPVDDSVALAAALERLIDSPDLLDRLGRAAGQRVQRDFSQQTILAAHERFYHGLMEGRA